MSAMCSKAVSDARATQLRVTTQLIDAGSGAHVWSDSWDRPAGSIFAVQTEIAEHVANRLGPYGILSDADRAQVKRKRPENLGAYEILLLAQELLRRFTPEGAQEALELLRQAIAKDPQLARAWTSMAYANLQSSRWADDHQAYHEAAVDAGRRAVQLDPADAYAHAAFGEALGTVGDLAQAEVEYNKALDLNPSSADILTFYSGWAMSFGKPEAGCGGSRPRHSPEPQLSALGGGRLFRLRVFRGRSLRRRAPGPCPLTCREFERWRSRPAGRQLGHDWACGGSQEGGRSGTRPRSGCLDRAEDQRPRLNGARAGTAHRGDAQGGLSGLRHTGSTRAVRPAGASRRSA